MRIIKYRGKEIKTGKWVYGSFVNTGYQPYIIDGIALSNHVHVIGPETVGVFLEHFDKHNNEIYDGDILTYSNPEYKLGHETPYVIKWSVVEAGFVCVNKTNFMLPIVWKDMEIIGNVVENPELIE